MLKLLLADWLHADVAAKPIREDVFIKECHRPKSDEWDDEDDKALHVVASLDGNAIGTARLTADGVIGHIAVLADFRHQGVATAMLKRLIEAGKQSRLSLLTLNSPNDQMALYLKQGFISVGDSFIFEHKPHTKMQLKLS